MFIALIYHWNAFNIFNQIRSESTRLLVSTMVSSKEVLPESSFIGVLPNVQYSSSSSRLHLVLTLAIAIIVIPVIFRVRQIRKPSCINGILTRMPSYGNSSLLRSAKYPVHFSTN